MLCSVSTSLPLLCQPITMQSPGQSSVPADYQAELWRDACGPHLPTGGFGRLTGRVLFCIGTGWHWPVAPADEGVLGLLQGFFAAD